MGGDKTATAPKTGKKNAGVVVNKKSTGAVEGSDLENDMEQVAVLEPEYTDLEIADRGYKLKEMERIRNARENTQDEFNGMGYLTRYIENFKAGNSYTPPRRNLEDTSIVTGTTREKKNAIINAVLNLVFDVSFRAFDHDNLEDQQLGEAMTDCVFQSNQVEQWDEKKIYAYSELADQGDVFIEDLWVDEKRIDKKRIKIRDLTPEVFKNFDPGKAMKNIYSGPRRRVIPGPQVYLGNIRQPDIKLQPKIFTRQVISYAESKTVYGHLHRFDNVPRDLRKTQGAEEQHFGYNWRLESLDKDMVEVICFQNKYEDEYQIFLNGVMMLPVGFPMPWEYGEYNIIQGHLEPISAFFAYSKSVPDKTFLDQQVLDEMYRLAVLKTQKSFMPPIANYSANILTKNMFLPGMVNNDLDKGDVEVLGGNPQLYQMSQSEFEMIKMVKNFVDEKSVSPSLSGQGFGSRTTATEVDSVIKQAKQQLGIMIFGFMNLHLQLDLIRLYILLENYTKEHGDKVNDITKKLEKKFAAVSVERDIGGRGLGLKRIEFTENPLKPDPNQPLVDPIYDLEEGIKRDENGTPTSVVPPKKPVKIMQIKPSTLRSIKYKWYPEIQVNERESSLTDKISFEDRLVKANQLWGPGAINQEYSKQQWAVKNKINPSFFFTQGSPPPMPQDQINQIQESSVNKINRSGGDGVAQAARQGYGGQ